MKSTSRRVEPTAHVHSLLSMVTISAGAVLMIFMIVAEDEPGAIPLLMIVLGAAWYLASTKKAGRNQQ
ncbi:MAG: hypothetical protein HKN43_08215 [Rhodothermales bacterium]|nr:hypothetical protein [Rhodothermales bacterium]